MRRFLHLTSEYTNKAAVTLFEPGFLFNNTFVRPDILIKSDLDKYEVIEVKATSALTSYCITDLSIQSYVIKNSAINLSKCSILHLNKDVSENLLNKYPFKEISLNDFFILKDVTEEVLEKINEIPAIISNLMSILHSEKEPEVSLGKHCHFPSECPYFHYCKRQ